MNTTTKSPQDQGAITPAGRPGRAKRGGLVYKQQSSEASTEPSGAVAGTTSPAASPASVALTAEPARFSAVEQRAGRWRATLTNGVENVTIDSNAGRLARCQRRVHAWAETLPKLPRVIRRAGRKLNLGPRMVMLTLTYAKADDWAPNQIRDFMKAIHIELEKNIFGYAWVLEMQERGAPHYHVLLYVKRGTKIPRPDEKLWKYGMSRIETVKTPYYICKYTSAKKNKAYQKEGLPAGARMFAVKIYLTDLGNDAIFNFKTSTAPRWLVPYLSEAYSRVGLELRWIRCKGGGWLIEQTGEVLSSPWRLVKLERVN